MKFTPSPFKDACEEAEGADVAGKRIRVTYARPRHVGPRHRYSSDKYRGMSYTLCSCSCSFLFMFLLMLMLMLMFVKVHFDVLFGSSSFFSFFKK